MRDDAVGHDWSAFSDGLGPLVPCPFCGSQEGYRLEEGPNYRWWVVQCKACHAAVTECSSDRRTQAGTELPKTWAPAHEAWNEAGQHAQDLRNALYEADIIACCDPAFKEWRLKWAHLWPNTADKRRRKRSTRLTG